ncbi:JHBP [Nesidiocoris tenuis]|uniref:JHBP n=1 Tax=Nesidiocoris tenuis TaxID=355587 RepID=A0ABN7A8D6_9HEMI|nr:JHBP [Nesidiocoris tenuis]
MLARALYLFVLVFGACSPTLSFQGSSDHGSGIDGTLHRAVERLTGKFKTSYTFPDTPTLAIQDPDVNLKLKLKNSTVSNTNFTINYVRSNLLYMWAKYLVRAPSSHVSGTYKIYGRAFNKKISGSGNFTSSLTNLEHEGFIQMEIANGGMQIAFMQLDYNLESFQHNITGLTVDGLGGQKAEEFLRTELWPWLEANKATVGRSVGELVKGVGNNVIEGKTLAEIVSMIKFFARRF